jgi:hypothetical protein
MTSVNIDELVKMVADVFADGKVTYAEIVKVGGKLAGTVNTYKNVKGSEKQALVLQCIELGLEKALEKVPEEKKEEFKARVEDGVKFAKETLPAVLDLAISAARGQLDLQKTKETCFSMIMSCVSRQMAIKPVPAPVPATAAAPAAEAREATEPVPSQ